MFKKIMQKLQGLANRRDAFDPSRFDDPIAMQTEWTPAKSDGASFRTHKLVRVDFNRLEFRASMGAKLFYLVFLLAGVAMSIGFSASKLSRGAFSFDIDTIMPVLIGLFFAIVGGCLFYFGTVPIVFDKSNGSFWKGWKAPNQAFDKKTLKHYVKLEKIHALQLISEYCRGNKSSYYSYELNLVLKDGKRVNVIDHGNQKTLKEDAATLATFLRKPLWDAL